MVIYYSYSILQSIGTSIDCEHTDFRTTSTWTDDPIFRTIGTCMDDVGSKTEASSIGTSTDENVTHICGIDRQARSINRQTRSSKPSPRRIQCPYCQLNFASMFTFKRHLVTYHKDIDPDFLRQRPISVYERPISCPVHGCSTNVKQLRKHLNVVHNYSKYSEEMNTLLVRASKQSVKVSISIDCFSTLIDVRQC